MTYLLSRALEDDSASFLSTICSTSALRNEHESHVYWKHTHVPKPVLQFRHIAWRLYQRRIVQSKQLRARVDNHRDGSSRFFMTIIIRITEHSVCDGGVLSGVVVGGHGGRMKDVGRPWRGLEFPRLCSSPSGISSFASRLFFSTAI